MMERLGADAFDGLRLRREGRWVVCFAADWCPFCRAFLPQLARHRFPAGTGVAMADLTDEEDPRWTTFEVEVVPTLALFENGDLVGRWDGRLGQGLGALELRALSERLGEAPAHSPPGGASTL